jgi:DMSO/TMAO reductase YedYZ molybdopterin-dependent catalytic subunit
MNEEPLSEVHGFPVRIAAIGKYAYKWCKWLNRISLADYDFKGHYEGKRGWSDSALRGERVT